ncbi:glycosyl transferase family 2 [Zobellella endophytica]|uniref:Glycosyl transferase family 2 n=2 Tax=Zobellella endophytica TaxID=2116700 RepID=A0A2P7RDD8_9GAMM|nr:glycosyl transferase family 2 [Zobellella endophytica]
MSPAQHYLRFGEPWGRKAGPEFDAGWYRNQYTDVAASGMSPLLHFIRHGEKEGRQPGPVQAMEWDAKLWRKEAPESTCLKALHSLLTTGSWREATFAAFALGRWYASSQQWTKAAQALACRHLHSQRLPAHNGAALLEADALIRTNALAQAWQRLEQLQSQAPTYYDCSLAQANLISAQARQLTNPPDALQQLWNAQRLRRINHPWQHKRLMTVSLINEQHPLSLDNLAPPIIEPSRPTLTAPLVSVIMPLYNAAATLATALRSLVSQTLEQEQPGALEVLVVDDASTDGSLDIARQFAERHACIKVITQPHNQGAYTARNRALDEARGRFITVHDSDDWSHPQKLALQMQALQGNHEWMASFSHWVRCSTDMLFHRWRMEEGWIFRNASSLMFRRQVFEELGYWDKVRADADTEYYHRILAAYGDKAIGDALPGVPLSFGRNLSTSLTQTSATHISTQFVGARKDYQDAASQWHAAANSITDLYMPANPDARLFTAPDELLP